MKELINIAKNIKAPGISIYLKEGCFEDTNKAKAISNKIEYLNLRRIVQHAEIHYECDPTKTSIAEDQGLIESHYELDDPPADMSPWVLRLVLDDAALDAKEMHLSEVCVVVVAIMLHVRVRASVYEFCVWRSVRVRGLAE